MFITIKFKGKLLCFLKYIIYFIYWIFFPGAPISHKVSFLTALLSVTLLLWSSVSGLIFLGLNLKVYKESSSTRLILVLHVILTLMLPHQLAYVYVTWNTQTYLILKFPFSSRISHYLWKYICKHFYRENTHTDLFVLVYSYIVFSLNYLPDSSGFYLW